MELIPTNIFGDVIMAKMKNKELQKQGKPQEKIPFLPLPYENKNLLWWHVPEFLEDNTQNKPVMEQTGGDNFWISRRQQLARCYSDEIQQLIEEKSKSNLWEKESPDAQKNGYLDVVERFVLFSKIRYLGEMSCNGKLGFHMSGLYLDYEKVKGLFDMKAQDAMRIVDNNLFLGSMATFYTASLLNHEPDEKCNFLKEQYKKTLSLVLSPSTHLSSKLRPEKTLSYQALEMKPNEKFKYKEMLDEHLQILKSPRTKIKIL